jgi:hypothetical protein
VAGALTVLALWVPALGGLGATPQAAFAAGPALEVGVHPASGTPSEYFNMGVRPGTAARAGSLTLTNHTGQALNVRLDPVNGVTDSMLGADYGLAGQTTSESTRWISLSSRRVVIPPHGARDVGVSLVVPGSAKPGEYLSGVAIQAQEEERVVSAGRGIRIGESYRYAIGVEIRLPGGHGPAIRLTGVQLTRYPASVVFLLAASNTGNVILKGVHGSVLITTGPRRVASQRIEPGTFVSHTHIELPVLTPHEHPSAGTVYCVRAELVYRGGVARLHECVNFGQHAAHIQSLYTPRRRGAGSIPWITIAVAVLAALLLVLGAYARRRRRSRYPLSRRATLSALRRALAAGREQGKPLGLIQLDITERSRSLERRLVRALAPTLRASDAIGRTGPSTLLVILPATGIEFAEGLAGELTAALSRSGLSQVIGRMHNKSAEATFDAETLMAQLTQQGADDQPSGYGAVGAPA